MKKMPIILISVLLLAVVGVVLALTLTPSEATFDFSKKSGEITHSATGFLYGIAEPEVPTSEITAAITPDTLVAKMVGGMQHPIGDAAKVAEQYFSCGGKTMQVYLQDLYPYWYYAGDDITDYSADFLNKVPAALQAVKNIEGSENFVIVPFNESDNGAEWWYGKFCDGNVTDGIYAENRQKFYADYKVVYDAAHALGLRVCGPNYCTYHEFLIKDFLKFCKENDCLPDVVSWHELIPGFGKDWRAHYDNLRAYERELGIEPIEICINEYGRMEDNGKPDSSLTYISGFESVDVSACIAYWRLANNLCDLTADANTPTASWWLYRWYAEMQGAEYSLSTKKTDVSGLASANDGRATALVSGLGKNSKITLKNVKDVVDADRYRVTIESVRYNGINAATISPTTVLDVVKTAIGGDIILDLNAQKSAVYRIMVSEYTEEFEHVKQQLPARYEAENASYSGLTKAGSVYAKSGEIIYGTADDAKVSFAVTAPTRGRYAVSLVYGNGVTDGSVQNADRTFAELFLTVDDSAEQKLLLPSTLKYIYTDRHTVYLDLTAGKHTLTFSKKSLSGEVGAGFVCYDFLDLERVADYGEAVVKEVIARRDTLTDKEGITSYIAVAADYGYYTINFSDFNVNNANIYTINGISVDNNAKKDGVKLYLKRGINRIEIGNTSAFMPDNFTLKKEDGDVLDLKLSDAIISVAALENNMYAPDKAVITGASDLNDGEVKWAFNVPEAGTYAVTVLYSNNDENGVHSYNTDLVERYATVAVNGVESLMYFRNTYSFDTFSPLTFYVELTAGENVLSFKNDGNYIWRGAENFIPDIAAVYVARTAI